jgi:hypothetical protein
VTVSGALIGPSRVSREENCGSVSAIDVVVCPDFAGPLQQVFAARTLLFLGSWLEHEGASRSWPLHLVCIGEPPEPVRELAGRCGATVSVRDGLPGLGNRIMNRLRGLEIESRTGRILMVDCDTIVLRDLAPVLELGDWFAAAIGPRNPLPADLWREIFDVAGVKMPPERVEPWVLEAADRLPRQGIRRTFREPMPPYFQAAVYLVPARSSLRANWERIQRMLSERYAGRPGPYDRLWKKTQCSLSVCVAILASEGIPWRWLPNSLNATHPMYASGEISCQETRIFHAPTIFRRGPTDRPLAPRKELDLYCDHQISSLFPETALEKLGRRLRGRSHPRGANSTVLVCHRLRELTARYVTPALGSGG